MKAKGDVKTLMRNLRKSRERDIELIRKWQNVYDELMKRANGHFEVGNNLTGASLLDEASKYEAAIKLLKKEFEEQ